MQISKMRTFNLHNQKPFKTMNPTNYTAPSAARLVAELDITPEQAKTARGLMHGRIPTKDNPDFPQTRDWIMSCYNMPSRSERIMSCLNELIGGYGTEAIWGDNVYWPEVDYINTGDTYSPTIAFMREQGRFILSSWGDIAERMEAAK